MKSKFDRVKVIETKVLYDKYDRLVVEDTLEFADGSKHGWVYFKTEGAVAVVALTEDNKMVLTRQYRHPMRKNIVDLPAGGIVKGEKPEQAALRELAEETGFTAGKLEWLGRFSWAPSSMGGYVNIFLAKDLKQTRSFDSDEIANVETISFTDVLSRVLKGEYVDSALVIGILLTFIKHFSGVSS